MIRNTHPRTAHQMKTNFIHRSSLYRATLPSEAEVIIKELRLRSGVTVDIADVNEDDIILPPKLPTPSVTLRSDVLPAQRNKAVL